MLKPEKRDYPSYEKCQEAYDILEKFTMIILFEFGKKANDKKDIIIRNFISRSLVSLNGIMHLWKIEDYHDCWVLNRCLLDRLFLLEALAKDNSFEIFEKWSFKEQYDSRNKVRSDKDFKDRVDKKFYKDSDKHKERYQNIVKEKIVWKKPKPEEIAKEMGMEFLYKYGYDYGSKFVHPMANDGDQDFYIKLNLPERDTYPDQSSVLANSFLVTKMLIQAGLNYSGFSWREVVFNFLDNFIGFIETDSNDWFFNMKDVIYYYTDGSLSKKI